jgi:divalent metal cation (Fe/Co/Zn/Cd) transporter
MVGDALAALLIAVDILRDGLTNVARSLSDVMDHHPVDIETDKADPILENVRHAVRDLPWVSDERVLLREHGRYLFAEIFVRPHAGRLPGDITEASGQVRRAVLPLDWRLQHVAIEITDDPESAANVLTREELDVEAG